MNRLNEIKENIEREYSNIKKSVNNAKTKALITKKKHFLNEYIAEYKLTLILNKDTLSTEEFNNYVETYQSLKNIRNSAFEILEKSQLLPPNYKFKQLVNRALRWSRSTKMPDPFDIKTATALVQTYDGSADGLDAFLDATSLLNELTTAAHQPVAVKFLKTRLTGKARLGLPEDATTIEAITQDVKNRCASKTTPENITAKLKAVKQKTTVETFCEEVDALTTKLKAVYLQNKVPEPIANSMATKAGVDALVNGTNSQETKIILKAGTFGDIKDAIQKVLENTSTNTQVLSFNVRNANQRYVNQNPRFRNFRGNNRNQQNGHREQQQNNRFRHTSSYQPQNNQHRYNNGYNNRGQRGRQQYQQRHIYSANIQQVQPAAMPMPVNVPMAMGGNHQQGMVMPTTMMPNNVPFLGHPGQVMTPQQ